MADVKAFDTIRRSAKSTLVIAKALLPIVKEWNDEFICRVENILNACDAANEKEPLMKKVCAVITFSHMLLKPAEPGLAKALVALSDQWKKKSFFVKDLPKFVQHLYMEAVKDTATDTGTSAIEAESTATGSSRTEPEKATQPPASGGAMHAALAALKKRRTS